MADADVMGIRSVREIGIAVKFLFVVTEHALAWGAYPNISFLVFQYGGNPGGDGLPFIGLLRTRLANDLNSNSVKISSNFVLSPH